MNKTLLDTDILSEILKGRDEHVAGVASAYLREHQHLALSAVTVLETPADTVELRRESKLESFERALAACEVFPFDDPAARIAGRIYADLELRGRPVGMPDVMIAAIALQHGFLRSLPETSRTSRPCALPATSWRSSIGEARVPPEVVVEQSGSSVQQVSRACPCGTRPVLLW
jgi:predicted nucleic acid-binding protein